MLKLCFSFLGCVSMLLSSAQKSYGVSQEYYLYRDQQNFIVPLVYFEFKNSWYTSFRYNYEESQTSSFQFGKKFSIDGRDCYSVTPLLGVLAGQFQGLGFGTIVEADAGIFSLYTEPEYCMRFNNASENFFYNWGEISLQPHKLFYTGLALQTTKYKKERFCLEAGVMIGFTVKNFEVPLYLFRTAGSSNYLVVGLHWSLTK